jgi:general secretion pathway protein N
MFSPERRPPVAVVAPSPIAQPVTAPKPRDPERPQLSLIGTVVSNDERFGLFLDQMTQAALRLRMGESYRGWNLRLIQGREATLEKDQEAITLALPQRGAEQSASEVRLPPVNASKLLLEKSSSQPGPLSSK